MPASGNSAFLLASGRCGSEGLAKEEGKAQNESTVLRQGHRAVDVGEMGAAVGSIPR